MSYLGRILLVANPAAQNGAGAAAIDRAAENLRAVVGQDNVVVAKTLGPLHAIELAKNITGCQTVAALGGDGVVHEVANGLMQRPLSDRPTLGVLPLGSGNDYARALGLTAGDVDASCAQLLAAHERCVDVGLVNGVYFTETLSFGLDAAIALDTMERRKRTGKSGLSLYMASGFDQLLHHLDFHHFKAVFDGEEVEGQSVTFAVQVGPYYGGGFKICPEAALDDGLLDICYSIAPVSALTATRVFLSAKDGKHVSSKHIAMRQAAKLHIEFEVAPPAQVDGERIEAKVFDIATNSGALRVLA